MKLNEFLGRLPDRFAIEILESLPGPDRKDLVRRHGAKIKVGPGSLKRADRMAKEAKLLLPSLIKDEDLDEGRTYLQGWLARRAEMIVAFLDAWEIEHQGGIVEDFEWVEKLTVEQVKESMSKVQEDKPELEAWAPLVYFAYLEMPCTAEVVDVDALLAQAAEASGAKK